MNNSTANDNPGGLILTAEKYREGIFNWIAILESLQRQLRECQSIANILQLLLNHTSRLIDFDSSGFFMVNEKDGGFDLTHCRPFESRDLIQKLVDDEIQKKRAPFQTGEAKGTVMKTYSENA